MEGLETEGVFERPEWAQDIDGFELRCEAFGSGDRIPVRYTADGDDLSPPLAWGKPPEGTRSLVLIMDDPDAPGGTFTHWMVIGLPPGEGDLVEGRGTDPSDVAGGRALRNDFGQPGWGSPAPPSGVHRYRFRVLALDVELDLPESSRRADLERALQGHVIAEASVEGRYGRD